MANLYGVANAPGSPLISNFLSGGVDVSCPGGVITPISTFPAIVAPSQGFFYAIVWAMLAFTNGATPPNALAFYASIGAGAFANGISTNTLGLTASGTNYITFCTATVTSQVAWQGAGSTVVVGLNPATNAVTVRKESSLILGFFRAPDQ